MNKTEAQKESARGATRRWRTRNPEYTGQMNEANRRVVLEHYSGSITPFCKCCLIDIYEFLGIDHIKGQTGRKRTGQNLYAFLIKNGFPEGHQVLCHNCNIAKGLYGICPHKILPASRVGTITVSILPYEKKLQAHE